VGSPLLLWLLLRLKRKLQRITVKIQIKLIRELTFKLTKPLVAGEKEDLKESQSDRGGSGMRQGLELRGAVTP